MALVHIFAGYDAGWRWVGGRLVDCYGETPPVDRTEAELFKGYKLPEGFEELSERWQDFHRRNAAMDMEDEARSREIWLNARELTETPGAFRCPKRYRGTPLFTVPADATPEWLAARNEVHLQLKAAWKRGDHKDPKPNEATKALAASVLAAIAEKNKG